MQTGVTSLGFRILSVPNPTNWRTVPLSEFDCDYFYWDRAENLVAIVGDNTPVLIVAYHDGIVEYNAAPTAESLNAFYRSSWMGQSYEQVRAQAEAVSKCADNGIRYQLLKGLENLGSALDVGAGYGDQVWPLKRIAKRVTVVEPCEVRAKALRDVYGCETLQGSFPDVQCKADLIVCHHVIEHVRNAAEVFAGFVDCQPDGGRLVITCPDYFWEPSIGVCLFWPHLRSFTRDGLLSLAGRFGYMPELDLSNGSDLAFRFVKRADWAGGPVPNYGNAILDKLKIGLGLGGNRLLMWERDYDGAVHVSAEHAALRQRNRTVNRTLEIEDITERKTDCPIEIQWAGPTQVFVK